MALLGSSVDPRLFMQDYSGFTRAAEIQAQGMQNLGASIGGAIDQVGDYFKKQKESKNLATMGLKIAEAAKIMDPAQAPYYDQLINTLKDENTPVDVRGALGAQVQDLLKQNTSMRAVAVQEAQLGGLPAYFGGPARTQSRSYGGGGGYSRQVDMSAGDRALANQPLGSQGMIPDEQLVLPGEAGADVVAIEQKIQKAQQLGIPAEQINPIITGIQSELSTPFAETQDAVQAYNKNLDTLIANAVKNFEPAKDAKGQPQVVISEDESGNVSRYTKTVGGNLITPSGTVLTPEGKPVEQQQYKKFDVEAINRALYGEGEVLPPLPPEDAGTLPPEASRTAPPSFQELTAVPPIPEGGVQRIGEQEPQPEQKSAGLGLMAAESVAKKKEKTQSIEAIAQEYNTLTKLTPRKQNLFNSALNQAYQDPKTAPSQDVIDEMDLQLRMQPESKGPQMMSEDEYNRRNVALVNKAAKRVGDRSAAYTILSRFDTAQKLANHPKGSKVFGKSIPMSQLQELARTEGGVYALYYNLKGQDLVQAMRDIKAQSGTAAGMSEKETMALQRAVNDLDLSQDWESAQKTLMRISNDSIRAGKRLGLSGSIFEVIPKTRKEDGSKYTVTKASEILDKPESVPIFRDEIEYFNRVNELQKRLQTSQGAGTTPTQNAPVQQPVGPDAVRSNLDTLFDLNR